MKFKEIKYITASNLTDLQHLVNTALLGGWNFYSDVKYHGEYVSQTVVAYSDAVEFRVLSENNELDLNENVNVALREGYKIYGHTFSYKDSICQTVLRYK